MNDIGIEIDATHKWKVDGTWIHIEEIENPKQLVRDKSTDRMWLHLSKQRLNYQGMEKGREEGASEAIGKTLPKERVDTKL